MSDHISGPRALNTQRQFEFVKTQWFNDGLIISAPPESDPLVGPRHDPGQLHNSANARSVAGSRTCHRSSSPAAASTASPPAGVRCAGSPTWTPDESPTERGSMMSTSSTDRWAALDFGPPAPDVVETEAPVLLDYLSQGRVARITLNRPHADNAITTEMGALLTEVVEEVAVRTAVRVVVLTGAGKRAFSVGSDLRQRKSMTKEDWLRQRQAFDRTLYTVRQLRKPIFAAVNGIAYGGGCELAQSTDFIIASATATFGQPEAMLGLAAGGGSPALLPRLLPRGRALQMLMTGDPIPAQEAYRLGMVNELHDPNQLMSAAQQIAEKIAGNSPTAVQSVKRAVHLGEGQPIEQAIAIMMDAHWRSAVHPDRVEGIGAFNDGREPTFNDSDF
ncbi:MAG TPA: enoyl-CoA hydratase/isomerase family protein [Nocardioidaceae bacterium]|nr:enoyl-CoA hydratase/isomerase family protein [Nocardioidaceae bacterium]